jgi:hypothetical protein
MDDYAPAAYLESEGVPPKIPLERFLPPYSLGVVRTWLAGYKILVANNNPVNAFLLTMLARAPKPDDFQSVIAELSIQKRGEERIESHIKNLYLTRCATCGRYVSASAFMWRRGEVFPHTRIYDCSPCGDSGPHPVTDEDMERLVNIQKSEPLHRARALERVPEGTREAREHLEEALKIYSARSLYALFTLINKVEGLSLTPERRALYDALLLSALDAGHSMWELPENKERPRLLNIPAEFLEKNVWMAMEEAVADWTTESESTPLSHWPDIPGSSGISLFTGRMRELGKRQLKNIPESIVCILPRPNQAFWTLSTLWSSWLWGKEKTASLKNVLERRRFDWYWHTNALQSALAPAAALVGEHTPILGLIPEPVAGLVTAGIQAGAASGFFLSGAAYKNETDAVQIQWHSEKINHESKKVNTHKIVRESIHDLLLEIGEPSHYLKIHTASICALARSLAFPLTIQQLTYEKAMEYQSELSKVFLNSKFLRRFDSTAQDLESGLWWLAQDEHNKNTLADLVEIEIVKMLQVEKQVFSSRIQQDLNQRFPGFLTPQSELIMHCLGSYAEIDITRNFWTLRKNESTDERSKDLNKLKGLIEKMGASIGVVADGENPINWFIGKEMETPRYQIYLSASALINRFTGLQESGAVESVFVFPGSRSALINHKLDRDPRLRERVSKHWHFLKFRTLRELANRKDLSLDLWDLFIDSDPISLEDATQLSMFL